MNTSKIAKYADDIRQAIELEDRVEDVERRVSCADETCRSPQRLLLPNGVSCSAAMSSLSESVGRRRCDLENAVIHTPPDTLDDVADILAMIVKKNEDGTVTISDRLEDTIRACIHRLSVEGYKTRIKDIYFSHIDFAPWEHWAEAELREIEAVLTSNEAKLPRLSEHQETVTSA